MVNNDLEGLRVIKKELEQAVLICSDRCLYQSTKWLSLNNLCISETWTADIDCFARAAEILDGIHPDALDHEEHFTHIAENMQNMLPLYESTLPPQSEVEYNKYQYAKALFQMRQYDNAAFILSKFDTPKSRFLRLYSKYLVTDSNYPYNTIALSLITNTPMQAGEKRKEEETQDILSKSSLYATCRIDR